MAFHPFLSMKLVISWYWWIALSFCMIIGINYARPIMITMDLQKWWFIHRLSPSTMMEWWFTITIPNIFNFLLFFQISNGGISIANRSLRVKKISQGGTPEKKQKLWGNNNKQKTTTFSGWDRKTKAWAAKTPSSLSFQRPAQRRWSHRWII